MTDEIENVRWPPVNPDNVVHSVFEHVCPFATGQMRKWRCKLLARCKGRKTELVRCPPDEHGTMINLPDGKLVCLHPAPSACPLRTGPVIVYDCRFADAELHAPLPSRAR